ncbi:outer membrane lipid asymmetry maintenance protein MlaD [Desulfobulbus elongatus]|uniref:outer membrane lipid asymmetry maintenance protein MlaD n=1 Tax=Desulfobulbus elongatus TaxID=53332 RepID=UPI000487F693|nr:outer membrane lipid asymmetry maintenance protein MlaD [Desulfobulbus elongatus]
MGNSRMEIVVGFFLIGGFLALGWLALRLGEVPWVTESSTYAINAEFNNISGVKAGADVQIAGVVVGKVRGLSLNDEKLAVVNMQIDRAVAVPVDSVASVKSQGIIGDKYILITLGGDESNYKPGETIVDTESAVDLESLISKFAFGQVK